MKKALLAALALLLLTAQVDELPNTGLADADTFRLLYAQWLARNNAADRPYVIPLIQFGTLSRNAGNGEGSVSINLKSGAVTSTVTGLPAGDWELYVVDNRPAPNHSTLPGRGGSRPRSSGSQGFGLVALSPPNTSGMPGSGSNSSKRPATAFAHTPMNRWPARSGNAPGCSS